MLKAGRIVTNDGTSTFDVTIREMSETGARLLLKDPWNLPDKFDLLVTQPGTGTWTRHTCEKRWQKAGLIGVRFADGSN